MPGTSLEFEAIDTPVAFLIADITHNRKAFTLILGLVADTVSFLIATRFPEQATECRGYAGNFKSAYTCMDGSFEPE